MHSAIAGGDIELHGFSEYRFGMRIESDPFEDDISLNEIRTQADVMWYGEVFTAQLKGDLIYDDQADDQDDIDLETGHGFIDLRQANIIFSPVSWMDIKLGRQVLTWGTGDLVFINDLFPKDWQSFFLGRDTEYLKAPSDALFFSFFPGVFNVDIAYTPRFDADRHITGERISYWNGMELAGQNDILITDRPNEWFKEDEIATRFYRNLGAFEVAGYTYFGYWKSPGGVDPSTGHMLFPELSVYGMSIRGPVAGGIAHLEAGYYDSREDPDGNDPFINNSEIRALIGYEWEPVKDVTIGVQYYLERMIDYDAYTAALRAMNMPLDSSRDEDRHTVTARLTWMTLNQNLIFNCFTRYSPSDEDVYVKPEITYKVTDRWQATIGGDVFSGSTDYTFLGQFQNNSNIHAGVRYSF
ncbi:hypothetical protein JW823_10260 [bacterium]|nr:hypothetical protein [candidate division CSSED10-310 bacterium]